MWRSLLSVAVLALLVSAIGCQQEKSAPEGPARKISKAYQIDSWPEISAIKFTYNEAVGADTVTRDWTWYPDKDSVEFTAVDSLGHEEKIAYKRSEIGGPLESSLAHVDQLFLNDQYWLLFPFHLAWDKNIKLVEGQVSPLPIPPGDGNKLVVSYGEGAGFTTDDTYDLYYDPDYFLIQWVWHRADGDNITTTWERHAKAGPIIVSLLHRDADGKARVWFDRVGVVIRGGEFIWKPAVPIPE